MKWWSVFFLLYLGVFLSGCTALQPRSTVTHGQQAATVVFTPTDCDSLLACVQQSQELSRKEFKTYFQRVVKEVERGGSDKQLQFICLSLNHYASYKQMTLGMQALQEYIKVHPGENESLQGLYLLIERINREKINRWTQRNRLMDEKEALEDENRELFDTVTTLEKQIEQDGKRIGELQKQIEQLKNIENIIKNREL